MREPYSIEDVITNCAYWNDGNPDLSLLVCKICYLFWICSNQKKGVAKSDGKNKMLTMR